MPQRPASGIALALVIGIGLVAWALPDALTRGSHERARGVATIDKSTGQVTRIDVIDRGAGYTSPPRVTLSGGNGTGAAATVVAGAVVSGAVVSGNVVGATVVVVVGVGSIASTSSDNSSRFMALHLRSCSGAGHRKLD